MYQDAIGCPAHANGLKGVARLERYHCLDGHITRGLSRFWRRLRFQDEIEHAIACRLVTMP
jgi:hypothetical protein